MAVIIKGSSTSKKIKDATITPDKILLGEIGYGNNNERIVGTHECDARIILMAKGKFNISDKQIIQNAKRFTCSFGGASEEKLDLKTAFSSEQLVAGLVTLDTSQSRFIAIIKRLQTKIKCNSDLSFKITCKNTLNSRELTGCELRLNQSGVSDGVFFCPFYKNGKEITATCYNSRSGFNENLNIGLAFKVASNAITEISFALKGASNDHETCDLYSEDLNIEVCGKLSK